MEMSLRTYTKKEVAKHNQPDDLWVIINNNVYNLSTFSKIHPGGIFPLKEVAGQDATEEFYGLHRSDVLENKRYNKLIVGKLAVPEEKQLPVADIPYAEQNYFRKHSPYYTESHKRFRAAIRAFVDKEIAPYAAKWDEGNKYPTAALHKKLGDAGILIALFGSAGELHKAMGVKRYVGGVDPDEWDEFHELIFAEEFRRFGCYGLGDGLTGGIAIGCPPILKFGSKSLVAKFAVPVIKGDKRIALCISEPYAGSDVAQLKTRAVLSDDGQYWILNGVKKWITGGMFADFFTVLAQTVNAKGKPGMTMMVVERDSSVITKPIKTSYSLAAGTSYVEFNETIVPVAHTIGKPGKGFWYCMANFNKERWGMVAAGNSMSRNMIRECFQWAQQRKIFGKTLIEQPVIRFKLAQMVAEVETVQSLLEDITYQMTKMTDMEVHKQLAGPIALLKYRQTRAATLVSDNACQIFGGRALTRTGMGQYVEKFQRSFKMQAILGGSEEVLADFAIRQAMRVPKGKVLSKL